jgi:hypothetical protein
MPKDKFSGFSASPDDPASSVHAVTPDDATDLPNVTVALNVDTPGTVRVTTLAGDIVDLTITAGIAFPVRVSRIWQTGTTATGIRALT